MPDNKAKYISVAVVTEGGQSRALPGSPPNPVSASQLLWVAGASCDILGFALDTDGTAPPTNNIQGNLTGLTGPLGNTFSFTWSVALDSSKRIFAVISLFDGTNWVNKIVAYPANSTGNVAPVVTITGPSTHLDDQQDVNPPNFQFGICLDADDNIYVSFALNYILKFAAGSDGDATPTYFYGPSGTQQYVSLFYDASHDWIWASNPQTGTGSSLDAYNMAGVLQRSITGSLTEMAHPMQVWVSQVDGVIYTGDPFEVEVNVFAASADGNVAPIRTFYSGNSERINGVAIDANNKPYVASYVFGGTPNYVEVFPVGANGEYPSAVQTMSNNALSFTDDDTPSCPFQIFIG